ncbi:MAG: hypothetical protein OWU33_14985 [Firmicutes bacterium]|nr:hypothetical protein [Bacillota bacterium]
MHSRTGLAILLGPLAATALLGGSALAAPSPLSQPFVVTSLSIAGVTKTPTQTTIDVNITVLDTGNKSGTWEFPTSNPQLLPAISVVDETTNKSVAGPGGVTASELVSSPDPTVQSGRSATATYAFEIPTPSAPGDNFSISLVDQPLTTDKVFHMIQANGSTAPVYNENPPVAAVGQLPEVPWAAALPLVALAMGMLWRRPLSRQRDLQA